MKLIIKVSRIVINCRALGKEFAHAISNLLHDGHSIVLIHGNNRCLEHSSCANPRAIVSEKCDLRVATGESTSAQLENVQAENRTLVALLAETKVAALGLCATDAGLIQLRRLPGAAGDSKPMEAALLNPKWLDIICGNSGVPVLSNLCLCICGLHHLIDPEHMAAVCAADWNADALIYLTSENGLLATDGEVIRWLDVEMISMLLHDRLSDAMQRRVRACAMALKKGVRRTKILPVSAIASLAEFYVQPIRCGTELISTR
jgi:acetylglutamate kinase